MVVSSFFLRSRENKRNVPALDTKNTKHKRMRKKKMNKEDKNTHRMIGQMILVDHILEKKNWKSVSCAPPRPKTSRPKSVRPKTTRPELEKKLEEDEREKTFPSWLQNRKTFRSIMNESVETIVNNNKELATYFHKQKSRPSRDFVQSKTVRVY